MEDKNIVPANDPVVESASASTDHEHNRAGAGPVIGVACALVVLCLLGFGIGGCVSSVLMAAVPPYSYWDDWGNGYDWDDSYGWDDDYGRDGSDNGFGLGDHASNAELTLEDGLTSYVNRYDGSLDDLVSATDYAGVPAPVRDWAKGLCTLDADTNDAVISLLRPALASAEDGDEGTAAEAVKKAQAKAQETAAKASELSSALPEGADGRVARLLSKAALAVSERWDCASEALGDLARAADGAKGTSLGDFEDTCEDGLGAMADEGYDSLMEALELSAA
ncbi:hypothetical protein AAK967_03500 [Atopobiaceae bacterium 24-176]